MPIRTYIEREREREKKRLSFRWIVDYFHHHHFNFHFLGFLAFAFAFAIVVYSISCQFYSVIIEIRLFFALLYGTQHIWHRFYDSFGKIKDLWLHDDNGDGWLVGGNDHYFQPKKFRSLNYVPQMSVILSELYFFLTKVAIILAFFS